MLNNTNDFNYLRLLSERYPTAQSAATEIINLRAILTLPKGTEHFMSDLHGEYEAFVHILNNASGVIKDKIDGIYENVVSDRERKELATLIYYPKEKIEFLKRKGIVTEDWYNVTLFRLVEVLKTVASKYTRSKVRKATPYEFSYIIDELMHNDYTDNKREYYNEILNAIIEVNKADEFIIAISELIRSLSIDRLHILGDIYDRGPGANIIVDRLMKCRSLDIEWGNHDIEWIGAAAGHTALIANVIRGSLKYGNFETIEQGYGINTRQLAVFAMEAYADDECKRFMPNDIYATRLDEHESILTAKMHKAISIIQFKLEAQIMQKHPEYEMDKRTMLDFIDYKNNTITVNSKTYELADGKFPTINPENPFELTKDELNVVEHLKTAFLNSEILQKHIKFIVNKGKMYQIYNGNLLFHGCIPTDHSQNFESVTIDGIPLNGKKLLDRCELAVRRGFAKKDDNDLDFIWYLWCARKSPLYGKDKITTFERYFTDCKDLYKENKNSYYKFTGDEQYCKKILAEFGLDLDKSHIINGHVPVKIKDGENPVKANGKLFVIDGGLSKAYQPTTGIAGYTLINNSYGFKLAVHKPFPSLDEAIENDFDLHSAMLAIENNLNRKTVSETDTGTKIKFKINALKNLVSEYENGTIKERF